MNPVTMTNRLLTLCAAALLPLATVGAQGFEDIEYIPAKVVKPLQQLEAIHKNLEESVDRDLKPSEDEISGKIEKYLQRFTRSGEQKFIDYWNRISKAWSEDKTLVIVPKSMAAEYQAYVDARRRLMKKGLQSYVEKDKETVQLLKTYQNSLASANDYNGAIAVEEALELMEGRRAEIQKQIRRIVASATRRSRAVIPIQQNGSESLLEGIPEGRQYLKVQAFKIRSERTRSHEFDIDFVKSTLGKNMRFGVYGAADTTGDQGLEVVIVNPDGEEIVREKVTDSGWKFFDIVPGVSGRWIMQLVDEDTSFTDDSPGNGGAVVVVRAPKPKQN